MIGPYPLPRFRKVTSVSPQARDRCHEEQNYKGGRLLRARHFEDLPFSRKTVYEGLVKNPSVTGCEYLTQRLG